MHRRASEDRLWDMFETSGDAAKTTSPLVETSTASFPGKKKPSAPLLLVVSVSIILTAMRVATQEARHAVVSTPPTTTNVTTLKWLHPTAEPTSLIPDHTCKPKPIGEMGVLERRLVTGLCAKGLPHPDGKASPLALPQATRAFADLKVRIAEVTINTAEVSRAVVRSCKEWLRQLLSKAAAELLLSKDWMSTKVTGARAAIREWHAKTGAKLAEEMIIA